MNCIIDNTINHYYRQGKKASVIKRYIKMRYRINMDLASINERLRQIQSKDIELA